MKRNTPLVILCVSIIVTQLVFGCNLVTFEPDNSFFMDGGDNPEPELNAAYGDTSIVTPTSSFPSYTAEKWLWVPVEGTQCMDGSQAGVSVRRDNDSNNLLIYFELGGACFNGNTCDTSLTVTKITEETRLPIWGMQGIFDFGNPQNPFKDYNIVYIPYCTGDVHTGSNKNTKVPGYEPLVQFVGGENYAIFLGHILATFPRLDKLVLSGFSGGALGAAFHAQRTARSYRDNLSQMYVLADSAVAMRHDYLPLCYQQKVYQLWNMKKFFPGGCDNCNPMEGGDIHHMYGNFYEEYPNVPYALITSHEDIIMRTFYGWSNNNCDPGADIIYHGDRYKASVFDMRDYFTDLGWGGTYFYLGSNHGMLNFDMMYTFGEEGKMLLDWLNAFLGEGKMSHVDVNLDPADL